MVRQVEKARILVGLAAVLLLTVGCEQPAGAINANTESNIIRVSKFLSADPWLSFASDGSGKVDGVRITVYLEGPTVPKGVFGDGTLVVEMYRLDYEKRGKETATLLHKWEMSQAQAYPWRSKKPTGMGWGYGLRLQWPAELEVAGKQVAFVVKYIRTDGRVISSSRQVVKVPGESEAP